METRDRLKVEKYTKNGQERKESWDVVTDLYLPPYLYGGVTALEHT